jgi:SOS regulatory protein LexA
VIDRRFATVDDLPVFRNTWGLANTISSVYRQLKTGRETRFCYDHNHPTSLELEWGGECELVEKEGLERLPVYGRIAAGQPIHLNPELDQEIYLPKSWVAGGQYFILKVYGDSMTGAAIDDGDLVLVRAQDAADNLDVVVVALGEEGTLKRFSKMGSNAILPAENPKYDPILLEDEQVRIMGIAVGVIKNDSPRS